MGVCPDPVRLWCPGSLPARPAPSCGSSGWKRAASLTCAAPSGAVNVSGSCPAVPGSPDPFACGLCDCFITSACGLLLCAYYRYFAAQTLRFFAAVPSGWPGSFRASRSCPAPSMEAGGLFLIRARVQLFPCSFFVLFRRVLGGFCSLLHVMPYYKTAVFNNAFNLYPTPSHVKP